MSTWRPLRPPASERDPTRLAESLDRLSRRLGGPAARTAAAVFDPAGWERLVGPDIAAHAKPVALRSGTLTLAVDDPAWAAQLKFMTVDLLARISGSVTPGEVREIQLKVVR